jgi:hypothetical protein
MIRTNSKSDSKVIHACCLKDQTDALLKEWLSLPPLERDRRFIDTACAAGLAGVTRRTIQAWIDGGEIKALCIGRKLHVDSDSLQERIRSETHAWASGDVRPARQVRKRIRRGTSI